MKLAIIHAPAKEKLSARLTLHFTGSTAYHCGFVDEESGTFYDMSWIPRKTNWPRYHAPKFVYLYDVPKLTKDTCELFLKQDSEIKYGVMDYILFGFRWAFHLVGKSTPNAGGWICSEMCAAWLTAVGYDIEMQPVPSPATLESWAVNHLKRSK
jgi:hypothetical protein